MMNVDKVAQPLAAGRLVNEIKPRRANQQKNRDSERQLGIDDHAPIPSREHERNKYQPRQNDSNKPFGQCGERYKNVSKENFVRIPLAQQQSARAEVDRQREEAAKERVDMRPTGLPDNAHAGGEYHSGDEADASGEKIPPDEISR